LPGSGGSAGYDDNGNETIRIWEKTSPTPEYPGSVKLSGSWKREVPTVYEWRHYNGFHQLIRVNQDDKEIICQYRGDGLRHSSEVQELAKSQSKTKIHYWDGADIVAEQTDGGSVKRYLQGINLLAGEADGMVYYYILNEHGDVAQLWGQSGTCKASYEYDAFGNERNPEKEDENPFRYCGEYFDLSSGTYYLRARYYNPNNARFLTEDTHWNTGNMIYGDNPQKIDERKDPLGLNIYTYAPDIYAIRQSSNLYAYCGNNPLMFVDPIGQAWYHWAAIAGIVAIAAGAFIGSSVVAGGTLLLADTSSIQGFNDSAGWGTVAFTAGGAIAGMAYGYAIAPKVTPNFKSLTSGNFRYNLQQLTGNNGQGLQAHHVLPQKFEAFFNRAGININAPMFGSWVGSDHQSWSAAYNKAWEVFFNTVSNPTAKQISQKATELAKQYGFTVNFK